MHETVPARQARRATAEHRSPAHATCNNERQLLARIAQLEQAVRLLPVAVKPEYVGACRATSYGDGPNFGRHYEKELNGYWAGQENLKDQLGRTWSRFFKAVVDDFGSLVEVPA